MALKKKEVLLGGNGRNNYRRWRERSYRGGNSSSSNSRLKRGRWNRLRRRELLEKSS